MPIVHIKWAFLTMVKGIRLGTGTMTALLKDRYFDPAENMNVLSSALGMLSSARSPYSV